MDLTYFNPLSQTEVDFLDSFVARQNMLRFLVDQLRLSRGGRAAQHQLIIAPRGFGKTSLLRRLAIAVRADDELRSRFIPLSFREEQHNVISLDVFWQNCLQSFLEAREDEGATEDELKEIDVAWENSLPRQALPQEEQDGDPARRTLYAFCERLSRRPLLLIDNLDTLLAGLRDSHQWDLRKRLQDDDGPLMIAAASRYPDSTHDRDAAFYEFFRIRTLDKLSDDEVFVCLRSLAVRRGAQGRHVLELLDKDPGRIAALNTLAGGNPRTLSVLYGVLESHASTDVLAQLGAMLDTFTGWYQARTEDLPIQARAVFDALALNWNPMTAAELGKTTGLDTPTVSSQLSRLERVGYVEPVALSKTGKGRKGFQLSERFFNIWYLMRNGPRRAKQSVRFLTVFLQTCFDSTERRSLAQAAMVNPRSAVEYRLALAEAIEDGPLRHSLLDQTRSNLDDAHRRMEHRPRSEEIESAGSATTGVERKKDATSDAEASIRDCDELVVRHGDTSDPVLLRELGVALVQKGNALGTLDRGDEAIATHEQVVARFGDASEPTLQEQVARALVNKGVALRTLDRPDEAIAAYEQVVARFGDASEPTLQVRIVRALDSMGNLFLDHIGDPARACFAFENGLSISRNSEERVWLSANLAYALVLHTSDIHTAEERFSEALGTGSELARVGRDLLGALREWSADPATEWTGLFEGIDRAVSREDSELWNSYVDDLQRLLWLVIVEKQGENFKTWMEGKRYPTRYAPLYHAFVAALEGEDHLFRVNAETRQPAEKIYSGIARRLRLYPTRDVAHDTQQLR